MSSAKSQAAYTLTDAGPLVAIIDKRLPEHAQIVAALSKLPRRLMLATWPCLTEVMYLLRRDG